ncbi:type VI secretion system-associated protein TagF [Limoniibacter endophyticus]|nr:type VI secretion system-associated protein TagF [Limoniibacter endophyticus]
MNISQKAIQANRIGFFGKVPAHGDFIASGFERATESGLDAWVRGGLQALRDQDEAGWRHSFAHGSTWRFVAERGAFGPSVLAGVILPSRDRVERCYPLVIATQMHGFDQHPSVLCHDDEWFELLTRLGRDTSAERFAVAAFSQSLKALRTPSARSGKANTAFRPGDGRATTLWWRYDPQAEATVGFRTCGAPTATDFARLFEPNDALIANVPEDVSAIATGVEVE